MAVLYPEDSRPSNWTHPLLRSDLPLDSFSTSFAVWMKPISIFWNLEMMQHRWSTVFTFWVRLLAQADSWYEHNKNEIQKSLETMMGRITLDLPISPLPPSPNTEQITDQSRMAVAGWVPGGILGFVVPGGSTVTGQSPVLDQCHGGAAILCGAWLWADSWAAGWGAGVAAAQWLWFMVHFPELPVGDSGVSVCHHPLLGRTRLYIATASVCSKSTLPEMWKAARKNIGCTDWGERPTHWEDLCCSKGEWRDGDIIREGQARERVIKYTQPHGHLQRDDENQPDVDGRSQFSGSRTGERVMQSKQEEEMVEMLKFLEDENHHLPGGLSKASWRPSTKPWWPFPQEWAWGVKSCHSLPTTQASPAARSHPSPLMAPHLNYTEASGCRMACPTWPAEHGRELLPSHLLPSKCLSILRIHQEMWDFLYVHRMLGFSFVSGERNVILKRYLSLWLLPILKLP